MTFWTQYLLNLYNPEIFLYMHRFTPLLIFLGFIEAGLLWAWIYILAQMPGTSIFTGGIFVLVLILLLLVMVIVARGMETLWKIIKLHQ